MDDLTLQTQLSPVLVTLFKGVIERGRQPALWQDLLHLQPQIMDYCSVIGLELMLDDAEGYAYLHQRRRDDDTAVDMPRLIPRRPLGYAVSLLCVLLRKKLVEADVTGAETRVILTRDQLVDMMQVFLPEQTNEARIVDQIDTHINRVVGLGFLRQLDGESPAYEVRRIIKAFVDADWLAELDEKLEVYRDHAISTA